MRNTRRQLMQLGMALFLLGLLTGLVEAGFANARMGLAAHLEGLMNGLFLVALGAIWRQVRLPTGVERVAYWSAVYGAYANWMVTTMAAILGTGAMTPIAAAGRSALPWQERLVTVGFSTVAVAMIAATVLVLWGLRGSED